MVTDNSNKSGVSGVMIRRRTWPPTPDAADASAPEIDRVFGSPERSGAVKKLDEGRWEITITRHPTRLTSDEKTSSLECIQMNPPAVYKHNFCPITAAQLSRCPIGGGTRKYRILNPKSLRNTIPTHFNLHYRSTPQNTFELKVGNHRGGFIYMTYPVALGPTHVGEEGVSRLDGPRNFGKWGAGRNARRHTGFRPGGRII